MFRSKISRKIELVEQKGIYAHNYISSSKRFDETKLPDKKYYEHAMEIRNESEMENKGDYLDFYLKLDVLLLADVFEKARNMCLEYYALDLNDVC